MKCTQCGAQAEGNFCPYCGATLESKPEGAPTEQSNVAMPKYTVGEDTKEKKMFYKKWWFWVAVAIVAMVAVIGITGTLGGNNSIYNDIEKFEWKNMVLAEVLPEPPSDKCSNLMNSESYLFIDIRGVSKNEYKDYVNACREKGFTVDLSETGDFYSASNRDGYELMLYYNDGDRGMSINLTAPSEEETEEYEPESADARNEKNGFDSKTNTGYRLGGYTIEIPEYWTSENKISGGIQRYAEKGGKAAMLQVTAQKDTDDSYPVTFDGLMDDNDNMVDVIESTAFTEVTDYEVIDTGVVKGILYKGIIEDVFDGISGEGFWFVFPSEEDRNWCTIIMCQSDNTDYVYNDDFMKIISSIKAVEEEKTTPAAEADKKYSEYEKAYIRDMSEYDLYYMFDTDTKKVVYFGTHDTYIDNGTYTGDFESGITITWSHGEWTEKFVHESGSTATMIDGNGFDWEFEMCDIQKAQDVLDSLR